MPFIRPRVRGKYIHRVVAQFDDLNHETLHAYAAFIDEPIDYLLNQLVDTVLARNKRYLAWRVEHPESYVSLQRPSPRRAASRRSRTAATPDTRVSDAPAIRTRT